MQDSEKDLWNLQDDMSSLNQAFLDMRGNLRKDFARKSIVRYVGPDAYQIFRTRVGS